MENAKCVQQAHTPLESLRQLANNASTMLLAMKGIKLKWKKATGGQARSQSIFTSVLIPSLVKGDSEKRSPQLIVRLDMEVFYVLSA